VAVLNLDDKAYPVWAQRAAGRTILTFSLADPEASFHAGPVSTDARGCPAFELRCGDGIERIQLNLLGQHNVRNALAAAAAARAMGATLPEIARGLNSVQPVKGRTVAQVTTSGLRVIDDTYNANPSSVNAAVDILAGFSGRTVLVLGDIGELGDWAIEGHRQVGAYARGKVDALYAVGPLMANAVQAFGENGRHFDTQAELIQALASEQAADTTILIKGSRSAAMEHVVAALCGASGETH
jgi:UDP-N-acetylmuramoyl-tripeptide--D-alanyl-D-alanine ligase